MVVNALKRLLSEPRGWRLVFLDITLDVFEAKDYGGLEDKFSEEEVLTSIVGLNGEKIPGPDGFLIVFWSFSWEFVKNKVMGFFKEFYEQKMFVRSLNGMFLVMIPKKKNIL